MLLLINYLLLAYQIDYSPVLAHGRLMEPAARNTLWRLNFASPPYYDDTELFCGGLGVQYLENQGKCGVCGDAYNAKNKLFETGGAMALNYTTRTYTPGSNITVVVEITTNHGGTFKFDICYRDSFDVKETEECFEPLKLENGSDEYRLKSRENTIFPISLTLPANRFCEACILRWNWRVANNWGACPGNEGKNDCTFQESWRNCADVRISFEKGIGGKDFHYVKKNLRKRSVITSKNTIDNRDQKSTGKSNGKRKILKLESVIKQRRLEN